MIHLKVNEFIQLYSNTLVCVFFILFIYACKALQYVVLVYLPITILSEIEEPCVLKFMKEINTLENDVSTLGKVIDLVGTLSFQNQVK